MYCRIQISPGQARARLRSSRLCSSRACFSTLVRARFAPSPTGDLHIGGLRTALFNALLVAGSGNPESRFILRIEDTDRARLVSDSQKQIESSLKMCGVYNPSRGDEIHVQSERLPVYQNHANKLIEKGKAYRCFCTKERLDRMRATAKRRRLPLAYDGKCRHLSREESEARAASGEPHTVRLMVDALDGNSMAVSDVLRGDVVFASDAIDDQVLLKSDGFPTYHLASVVDDHLMGITHVIRGEEWLTSTPKHAMLYAAFGWPLPHFIHLPLLLNADGSKLSKRQGHVSVEAYLEEGYLPSAVLNFVALLGWGPANKQDLFYSVDEMVDNFSLDNLTVSNAKVDRKKLDWINGHHIRHTLEVDPDSILNRIKATKEAEMLAMERADDDYIVSVLKLCARDARTLDELWTASRSYFFYEPSAFAAVDIAKRVDEADGILGNVSRKLAEFTGDDKSAVRVEDAADLIFSEEVAQRTASKRAVLSTIRWALTGDSRGAPLSSVVSVLGLPEACKRLDAAREAICAARK